MPEITWEHSNRSAVWQGHSRPVTYLTFDDSGKVLYTCGKDTAALRRAMQRQGNRASHILERKVPEDAPSISCLDKLVFAWSVPDGEPETYTLSYHGQLVCLLRHAESKATRFHRYQAHELQVTQTSLEGVCANTRGTGESLDSSSSNSAWACHQHGRDSVAGFCMFLYCSGRFNTSSLAGVLYGHALS